MGSKVANAVGVAQQYMPQEKEVYRARLQGVQQNWNVTADTNNIANKTAQALEALGIRIGDYALQKEKQDYEYANLYARQLFNQTTDEEKKKLSAMQLVTHYGSYKLADNKYAAAIIDEARGEWINNELHAAYLDWRKTQPPVATEAEEGQRYVDWIQKEKERIIGTDGVFIDNWHAFENGFNKRALEQRSQVANIHYENKEENQKIIRRNSILSRVTDFAYQFKYKKPTQEDFLAGMTPILDDLNSTDRSGSDPAYEYKLINDMYEKLAEQTGNAETLEWFGDLTRPNGTKFRDLLSPNLYKKQQRQYAEYLQNEQAQKANEWLDGQTSSTALYQNFNAWAQENPELAQMVAPQLKQRKKELEWEEKRAREAKANKKIAAGTHEQQVSRYMIMLGKLANGDMKGLSFDKKELEENVGSMEAFKTAVNMKIAANQDNPDGLARILSHPVVQGLWAKQLKSQLAVDFAAGKQTETIRLALLLANSSGVHAGAILGEYAPKVKALIEMQGALGDEQGMAMFSAAEREINVGDTRKTYEAEYTNQSDYASDVYDLDGEDVYAGITNLPARTAENIKELALRLRASGLYPNMADAKRKATEEIMKDYSAHYRGTFIPKDCYYRWVTDKPYTNYDLKDFIDLQLQEHGAGATWKLDRDNNGVYIVFSGANGRTIMREDKILNELAYVHDYNKGHIQVPSEDDPDIETGLSAKQMAYMNEWGS